MSAPGHTPGSTILVMSSGTARGLLLGDVVHCPVELLDDEWGGVGDVDPELAKRTRLALTRELEGTDTPVAAAHFRAWCSAGCSPRTDAATGSSSQTSVVQRQGLDRRVAVDGLH